MAITNFKTNNISSRQVAQSVQLLILKYSPENELESAVCRREDGPQTKADILECSLGWMHYPRLYFARIEQRCGPIF
jgi:hypothetical protein